MAWGHAAVQVDQTYISWWPERERRQASKVSAQVYAVHPVRNRSFHADVSDEGQSPDYRVVINGLDELKIKDWWQSFGLHRDGVQYQGPLLPWKTLEQNCSTIAARALTIGGGETYASWRASRRLVWTPNDVLQYAVAIKRGLAPKAR